MDNDDPVTGRKAATDEDDPVTGRRMLTQSAYADDRHIRSRQAIYAYAEKRGDPAWRTSFVPWDGTQIVVDVGCGNGFDLRHLLPEGRCRHAFGLDLSIGMLRSLAELRSSGRLTPLQGDAQQLPLGDGIAHVGLAMHMLYHVPDIQAAVRELRRVVKPGGTVLASTNSVSSLAEINDLLAAALAKVLGRPLHPLREERFNLEAGASQLQTEFTDVSLHRFDVPLAFPMAEPVLGYLNSVRDPIERSVGESFSFDAVLDDVAGHVEQVIRAQGCFRAASRMGVFVCR
jgi:SAM-dependent methyltransferase